MTRVVRDPAGIAADVLFGSFAPFEMGPMMEMQGLSLQGGKVTGAPYSAEAVTEMTQTLADGNRIVRSVSASVARDSEDARGANRCSPRWGRGCRQSSRSRW